MGQEKEVDTLGVISGFTPSGRSKPPKAQAGKWLSACAGSTFSTRAVAAFSSNEKGLFVIINIIVKVYIQQ
jgi:hypothetical protein